MDIGQLGADLRRAAHSTDHRRLVVLAGGRSAGIDAATQLLAGAQVPDADVAVVSVREDTGYPTTAPDRAHELLGATRSAVVLDGHDRFSPNALGQVAGVVEGGGLLVLVTPPLSVWPDRRDGFDASLAVPPFDESAVTGRFRRRLVATLDQPSVTVVNVDEDRIERDGRAEAPGGRHPSRSAPSVPPTHEFPATAYEACLTADQVRALRALEGLRTPNTAVVVEADRGRGKSAAAGLAAAALASEGRDVLVTAPERDRAAELFVRADALTARLEGSSGVGQRSSGDVTAPIETAAGGRVRFATPPEAAALIDQGSPTGSSTTGGETGPDVVLVDEAAGVPVRLLSRLLEAPAAGFCTTVHGYEGAGRGFSVRFRDRLQAFGGTVVDVRIDEPIRYAPGDPVETWTNRALLLDARPVDDRVVAGTDPGDCTYRRLSPDALAADEHLLRETFGLLVAAHYRTEPNDLARVLDAPNLRVRALVRDGHVVSVALLAREGGLDAETRRQSYDGARIRGNMLPDVLTSQVRDEDAGESVGYRVVRIATHAGVRSRGLGSRLLEGIRAEVNTAHERGDVDRSSGPDDPDADRDSDDEAETLEPVDWLGVAYGTTPELVDFWAANGYRTVQLSTSRNDTSGEYSTLMLRPVTAAGQMLYDRHAGWFLERVGGLLSDPLSDLDPDVVLAVLAAADADALPPLEVSDWGWRTIAGAAYGPGLYDVAPSVFRGPVLRALVQADAGPDLDAESARLLVRKVLQARPWDAVARAHDSSRSECMRAFGRACQSLVDAYGPDVALAERDRYRSPD